MWSLDQVDAEVSAWPLWADAGLRPCLTTLECSPKLTYEGATATCYAELEKYLRPRAGGTSLETLRQICDSRWLADPPTQPLPLHRYVKRLAAEHLEPAPGRPGRIRLRKNGMDALNWRWLTLTMPPDLLVAALDGRDEAVMHDLPNELAEMLDKGVAQVHVHLSACMSFGTLWTNAMTLAGTPFLDEKRLERGGPPPFGNGKHFRRWLLGAALVRTTLAAFLYQHAQLKAGNFACYVCSAWPSVYEQQENRKILSSFGLGTLISPAERIAKFYRQLGQVTGLADPVKSLNDLRQRDPVGRWLAPHSDITPEVELLRLSLRYLELNDDTDFARIFWQYVRVRGRTYRHIVQEPGTPGLDWFARHFQRISALRQGLSTEAKMEAAWSLENRGLRLAAFEAREAPEADWHDNRKIVKAAPDLLSSLPDSSRAPIGIIFHFKKEWRDSDHRAHGDPGDRFISSRYGRYAWARIQEADAIATAMEHCQTLLIWLRGLDVCSEELSIPNWVILPILAELRQKSKAHADDAKRAGIPCDSLRLTLHCGEDYRSLHEGLRRLHEPIKLRILESGDRIGHALALGHDVMRFMVQHPSVMERREDRLENLVWEWELYETAVLPQPGPRRDYLWHEIEELGQQIFGRSVNIDHMLEAYRLRDEGAILRRWGYPRLYTASPQSPAERLLLDYLQDCNIYMAGQQTRRYLLTSQDSRFLNEAQNMIKSEFISQNITIESNPSSNLLIGNLGAFKHHPVFKLVPYNSAPTNIISGLLNKIFGIWHQAMAYIRNTSKEIAVAISDDDPLTFSTSLHEEYVFMFSALHRHNPSIQQAKSWLEHRRRAGLNASFVLDASKDAKFY